MSEGTDREFTALIEALASTRLPAPVRDPLAEALRSLHAERPNAVNKLTAPLGRALRNPLFPGIWEKAVADVPGSPAYAPLREAALAIEAFVRASRG